MSQPVITQAPAPAQNGRLLSVPGRADETRTAQPLAIMTRGLVKSYGHFQALRGIDLDVYRGEIFGFLGPNGAGKTTTIRCLLDLIRPSGGTLRVLDLDPQRDPVGVRARIGYLPGELRLDDNLTAEGVLRLFDGLRGKRVDWSFVCELARRLDLNLSTPIKNYSKGNKQKVGVIQALMHRPELLLLDEPTSGLDPLVQQEVLRLISEAQANGATVFFSSHVLSEVQAVAERVAIIRRGEIVEVAATDALINRAFRRVAVRFREPVDSTAITNVPGVSVLDQDGGASLLLQVEGEMDRLIKVLAQYPVSDFETERPSLEEIFLAYYEADRVEAH
jgi:ABC-2 type transport system ATP-binding protein